MNSQEPIKYDWERIFYWTGFIVFVTFIIWAVASGNAEKLKSALFVVGSLTILFLLKLITLKTKPKKCSACEMNTSDEYRNELDKSIVLCRNHLLERWNKDVSASKYDMVAIEPDFTEYSPAYLYATVQKLGEWEYPKEAQNKISYFLDQITGKMCKECQEKATVAFFKKEDYEFPFLEKISATPTFLCKSCMIKKVEPILRSCPKPFMEGVYAPTVDRGLYHPQIF